MQATKAYLSQSMFQNTPMSYSTLAWELRAMTSNTDADRRKLQESRDASREMTEASDSLLAHRQELELKLAALEAMKAQVGEFREALKAEYLKYPSRAAGALIKRLTRILEGEPPRDASGGEKICPVCGGQCKQKGRHA